jgi:mono/diheme cytochrome c family protein
VKVLYAVVLLGLSFLLSACGMNMHRQPRAEYQEASPYFANGSTSQQLLEGVVSRNRGAFDASFYSGQDATGNLLADIPFEVTQEVLERGQGRYNIYCAPCHNYTGDGQGVIVQKGMPQPASFHEERLRDQNIGYFYFVATNGFGRMFSYSSRITPEDRWAIAAYVRTLQLSQFATLEDVPSELRDELQTAGSIIPNHGGEE